MILNLHPLLHIYTQFKKLQVDHFTLYLVTEGVQETRLGKFGQESEPNR